MKIEFISAKGVSEAPEAVAVLALEEGVLSFGAEDLDKATGGAVRRAVAASRFKGEPGQTLDLLAPNGLKAGRALIVGGGAQESFTADGAEAFAANAYKAMSM